MKVRYTTLVVLFICAIAFSQEWKTFKNLELGVIADFPGEPERMDQQVPVDTTSYTMKMYFFEDTVNPNPNNYIYALARTDYHKDAFEGDDSNRDNAVLDGAVSGAASNVKGTVDRKETITLNGFPGRAAKIKMQQGYIHVRVYLVQHTMYFTQVICATDKDGNADIKKFFDSFDIIRTKE